MKNRTSIPITVFILLLLNSTANAQTAPKEKCFGMGASVSVPFVDVLAGLPKGPALFYCWGKHEITAGLDMYRWTLLGYQLSYNYHFRRHFFLHTQVQYTQFGAGKQSETNYSVPSNIWKYKTFMHVAGIGYRTRIAGPLYIYWIAELGYNYYIDKVSDDYYPIVANSRKQKETVLKPMASLKMGISLNIWRNNKPPKLKKKKEEEIPWD